MKPSDKEKAEILKRVGEALDKEDPFMIILESSPEAAVMMGGDRSSLSRMLSIGMSKIPQLEEIVKVARKALKKARRAMGSDSMFESELLKCTTCDKKEDCQIRSLKERAMGEGVGPQEIIGLLKELISEDGPMIDIKSKGDC